MEILVLNGKEYVKASKAARDLGYTSDYVGQLCRGGHVDAHLVGRTWYVNPDTLTTHRVEKKRNARVKAREYAKKAIEESKSLNVQGGKNSYKNIAIRYNTDKAELMPEVRKVSIESEPVPKKQAFVEHTNESPYTVENKGEKVIMSGKIAIQDADVTAVPRDTVLLTPTIRKTIHKDTFKKEVITKEVEVLASDDEPETPARRSFAERIQDYQNGEENSGSDNSPEEVELPHLPVNGSVPSAALYYIILLTLLAVSAVSIFIEEKVTITSQSVSTEYSLNFSKDIVSKIKI